MGYREKYISLEEVQLRCKAQEPYDGYVEGLEYAFAISNYMVVKRKHYREPEVYFSENLLECRKKSIRNRNETVITGKKIVKAEYE